jgi:hypothetical protein
MSPDSSSSSMTNSDGEQRPADSSVDAGMMSGTGGSNANGGSGGSHGTGGRTGGGSGGKSSPAPDEAGNDVQHAQQWGSIGMQMVEGAFVGQEDPADYFKFTLDENATFMYSAKTTSMSVTLSLFRDMSIVDTTKPYASITATAGMEASQTIYLEKGTYYLAAIPVQNMPVIYSLVVSATPYDPAEPDPEPGQAWDDNPLDIGTIDRAVMKFGGYVGGTDLKDYYRFTLAGNAMLEIAANNVLGHIAVRLYDGSGTVNEAQPLAKPMLDVTATQMGPGTEVSSGALAAGTYYLLVTPQVNTNALYTLQLHTL